MYPLSGLLFCSDCNFSMIRKNNGTKENPYFYYICSGHKTKNGCTSHSMRDIHLENAVFLAIRQHISNILDLEEILKSIENIPYTSRQVQKCDKRLLEKKKEYEKFENNKLSTYEDFADGLLDEEEYITHKNRYTEKSLETLQSITNIEKEIDRLISGTTEEQQWISYFKLHKNTEKLTRKLAVSLLSKVIIYENQNIHIDFKFNYEYNNALSFVQSVKTTSKKVVM